MSITMKDFSSADSINQLSARHELMLTRIVLEGATSNEICAEFGMTPGRLSILRNSPVWKEAERTMRAETRKDAIGKLESLRTKAIGALESTINDPDPKVRLVSAREILNRTGLEAGVRIEEKVSGNINLYIPKNWNNEDQELEQYAD